MAAIKKGYDDDGIMKRRRRKKKKKKKMNFHFHFSCIHAFLHIHTHSLTHSFTHALFNPTVHFIRSSTTTTATGRDTKAQIIIIIIIMDSSKRTNIDWNRKAEEEVAMDEAKLIPWIKRAKDLFDVEVDEETGILAIFVKFKLFDNSMGDYDFEEVNYDRFIDKKYRDLTCSKWRFFVMVNRTELKDLVDEYFYEEISKGYTEDIKKMYYKVWNFVKQDPRKDYESIYLYFEAVMDSLKELGFNPQMCDAVHAKLFEGWTDDTNDKKTREMSESAITPLGKLLFKLRKMCEEKTNKTLSALEKKRKELMEKRESNPRPQKKQRIEKKSKEEDEEQEEEEEGEGGDSGSKGSKIVK